MKNFQEKVKTLIGYKETPNDNEFNHARKIAEIFKTDHHEIIISEKMRLTTWKN